MKTAISIPDDLFEEAEGLARALRISRSGLYSRAVREFLARHSSDGVTTALDAVYARESSRPDGFVSRGRAPDSGELGVVISRGEVWWAELGAPTGSGPGYTRPVLVVQCDAFNGSRIATVVCVPLTSNLDLAAAPGNVELGAGLTGLPKDSIANVSQILTVAKATLRDRVGKVPEAPMGLVLAGIDVVLGR